MEIALYAFFLIPWFVTACLFWARLIRRFLPGDKSDLWKPMVAKAARKVAEYTERNSS